MTEAEKVEILVRYLISLAPYCDNCIGEPFTNCDECYRKSFDWKFDPRIIDRLIGQV